MKLFPRLLVAAVAATTALVVAPAGPAAADGERWQVVSTHQNGSIRACQVLENTAYGPVYRVKVLFQRTAAVPYADVQVLRRYNGTEWSQVSRRTTDTWLYGVVARNDANASAALGDRVKVQFHDGMYAFGTRTLIPQNLSRC